MINLQNEYAKLIQQELDKNTQGLRFEVSLNNLKSDSELQRFLQIPNTYAQEIKRYIPVVIEAFDGDFAELENMSAAEIFANMTLLIPTDEFDVNNQVVEETFMLVSQALNEMSKRTRAKVFQLGDKCIILPKNNSSVIELDSIFGVNLEFEVEFTHNEDNQLFEVFGDKLISKIGSNVFFDNTPIITNYEINKRYNIKLFREDPSEDYFITVNDGNPVDLNYSNTDLTSEIKLLSQFEKVYSVVVTNHQDEIVYEENDLTILSNEGGIPWGSEGTITLNFSLPRRLSNQMTLGEYNYQEFEINSSGAYNDRAFVGQHIEYYLNGVRIFPVSRDEGYIGEPDNARFLGSNKGNRSVIEQTSIGKEYALYYVPEPKIVDLIQQITDEAPNANKLYNLKIVYPMFTREHTTVLSQGGLSIVNSTPLGISFALEIADEIIENELLTNNKDAQILLTTSSSFNASFTWNTTLNNVNTGGDTFTLSGGNTFDLNNNPIGTLLTITASDNALPGGLVVGGSAFTRWVVNGANQPINQKEVSVFLTQNTILEAIYDTPLSNNGGGGGIIIQV